MRTAFLSTTLVLTTTWPTLYGISISSFLTILLLRHRHLNSISFRPSTTRNTCSVHNVNIPPEFGRHGTNLPTDGWMRFPIPRPTEVLRGLQFRVQNSA